MKKKAYISPLVEVTRVVTHYHLCIGSTNSKNPTEGLDEDDLENGGDNPGNFSRRRGHRQWDDEELYEEELEEEEEW